MRLMCPNTELRLNAHYPVLVQSGKMLALPPKWRMTGFGRMPLDQDLIVFDGTCIFCSGFARFMARYDRKARFLFVTAQSQKGRTLYRTYDLDPDLMLTNIVIVNGKAHVKLAAFAAAMSAIGWPWRLCAVLGFIPQLLSDWLYDAIARNRYVFGRRKCVLPSDELRGRIVD